MINEPRQKVLRTTKPADGSVLYARVENATLQDDRLSFRARGILAYVLSKPADWAHKAESLAEVATEGVDAIRGALRELEVAGYAKRERAQGDHGRWMSYWLFWERPSREYPEPAEVPPSREKPQSAPSREKPRLGCPGSGGPTLGKAPLIETTVRETTVQETTERETRFRPSTVTAPVPPAAEVLAIYELYPRKVGRGAALKAIRRALKLAKAADLSERTRAFAEAVSTWPEEDRRFIPHPATWFNGERYADDPKDWYRNSRNARGPTTEEQHAQGW